MDFGIRGPSKSVVIACATGNNCIGDALRLIQYDEADAMVAGGSDAYVIPIGVAGFAKMRALSRRNNEPEKASRPFDKGRQPIELLMAWLIMMSLP